MYERIVLPNGVRIVMEPISGVRSTAIGIWVMNGSRHEPDELSGISHFIEHMVFKGTEKRSAQHIAIAMDAIGGQVNAFTTKECTCFYLKTLDKHAQTGVEILADMFLHSKFAERDLELERGVVLEEIDMYEDSPEDVATEKVFETCYESSALGRSILGKEETLNGMTGETLRQYVSEYYRPKDTVVAIAGSYTKDDIQFICDLFSAMEGEGRNTIEQATYQPCIVVRPKEIEQNHLCLAFPGIPMRAEERYVNALMGAILGGGMASRLFQTIREKNGLCYSIYSFSTSHEDTGVFGIYTALGKETEAKAIQLIREECQRLAEDGPDRAELSRCREQAKTNMLLGMESTSGRMNQLGRSEMFFGKTLDLDEVMALYDEVTAQDIAQLARRIFDFDQASICAVGQVDDEAYYEKLLRA
ncbi:MAG: pitrilysin family protein [Eubacteriales bacterium]|nr:pitrilysin family protein [Eubacteriales bacterium]